MVPGVLALEGFEARWEMELPLDAVSVAPMDYACSGYMDSMMVATPQKVYLVDRNGKKKGSYEFNAPVYVVEPLIHGSGSRLCYGLAGSWDGKVYAFRMVDYDLQISSWGKYWDYDIGERIYSLKAVDFQEDSLDLTDNILIGTGSYTDVKSGNLSISSRFGYPRDFNWSYGANDTVIAITAIDLQGDKVADNPVFAFANTTVVLTPNGTKVWEYPTQGAVRDLSYADFDRDGAIDDVLIGAGKSLYAVTSHKELIWEYTLPAEIVSISAVDSSGNGIIDYYLAAAGTLLYAMENKDSGGDVSWSYDTGQRIKEHVSLDFDSDGILDDIAIISGNGVYAYEYTAELRVPVLRVEKSLSHGRAENGTAVNITISLENTGNLAAKDIGFEDEVPDGLELLSGSLSLTLAALAPGEKAEHVYQVKTSTVGNYTLPPLTVTYHDGKGGRYTSSSDSPHLEVATSGGETEASTEEPEKVEPPLLNVIRTVDPESPMAGENISVEIMLRNLGGSPALGVLYEDVLPEGLAVVEGEVSWSGNINPGDTVINSYTLVAEKGKDEITLYNLSELEAFYKDSQGNTYTATDSPIAIPVFTPKSKTKYLLIPVIIGAVVFVLYRRGIIDVTKIKERFRPPEKAPKTQAELEKEFLQLYMEFQKKGKRPTYKDIRKKLRIDHQQVDEILESVKTKLKKEEG
jgi:uncharacterized repeat protein (TIGR01451 family)